MALAKIDPGLPPRVLAHAIRLPWRIVEYPSAIPCNLYGMSTNGTDGCSIWREHQGKTDRTHLSMTLFESIEHRKWVTRFEVSKPPADVARVVLLTRGEWKHKAWNAGTKHVQEHVQGNVAWK